MKATDSCYPFRLGKFKCAVISDGTITVPDRRIELAYTSANEHPEIELYVLTLLIDTGENVVLIDTGLGDADPRQVKAGKLHDNLEAAGISRSSIDTVIHTHSHEDHVGGNIDETGKPAFPNARFRMYRSEWDFWVSLPDLPGIEPRTLRAVRKNLINIKERFELFETDAEIMPGITFIEAPGHTPANILPMVTSGEKKIICLGDMLHDPMELEKPELFQSWDMSSAKGEYTIEKVIARYVTSDTVLFGSHLPFPGLGYIARKMNNYTWLPIGVRRNT